LGEILSGVDPPDFHSKSSQTEEHSLFVQTADQFNEIQRSMTESYPESPQFAVIGLRPASTDNLAFQF
jgi:hypothetical protein